MSKAQRQEESYIEKLNLTQRGEQYAQVVNVLKDMERKAAEENIPIIEKEALAIIQAALGMGQVKRILEVGTAIGYSAIQFAGAGDALRHVVTIEKEEHHAQDARSFVERAGLSNQITIHCTDALDGGFDLEDEEAFDVIFIDAAKGQYKRFVEKFEPYLRTDGYIISDNILCRGHALNPDEAPKRMQTMAKRIFTYNQWLSERTDLNTTFYSVGDGVAISQKCNRRARGDRHDLLT
ncbi:O-methyltransferase [Salsuginibacillus kocurii]|uniref:O-methyltransferase n=1 Tax=Salsuginibacillus kocurii TaxID=427078 RepID=UPI000368269A|nr:O-methyltransferase [Salsuginibacillus kocurii]